MFDFLGSLIDYENENDLLFVLSIAALVLVACGMVAK